MNIRPGKIVDFIETINQAIKIIYDYSNIKEIDRGKMQRTIILHRDLIDVMKYFRDLEGKIAEEVSNAKRRLKIRKDFNETFELSIDEKGFDDYVQALIESNEYTDYYGILEKAVADTELFLIGYESYLERCGENQ